MSKKLITFDDADLQSGKILSTPQANKKTRDKWTTRILRSIRKHYFSILFLSLILAEIALFYAVPYRTEALVQKGNINVQALGYKYTPFTTTSGLNQILSGSYNVIDGDNITILVLDEVAFSHWAKNTNIDSSFSLIQTTFGSVNLSLVENEGYYLVFDNSYSNANKTIQVDLRTQFVPSTIGIPSAYLALSLPITILFILVLLIVNISKKEQSILPKEYFYLLLFLGIVLALVFFVNPRRSLSESLNIVQIAVGLVVALVSLLVSIVALKISRATKESSERMMRIQLVYNDRKNALSNLMGIMHSKKYYELIENYNAFKNSNDWLFIPEEVKEKTKQEINALIKFADEEDPFPEPPTYAEDEAYWEEQEEEVWDNADPYEQFMAELSEKTDRTMGNIESKIKEYLANLSKE